jgi:SAM-dependent methyltransferase
MTEPLPEHHSARDDYEGMAEKYIAAVDSKPYNALYERPAVLSLLPPLAGLDVLDAGCGSGWYGQYYLENQVASLTCIDVSPKMLAATRSRLGERARILEADLEKPLTFAPDGSFDLIVAPLVMHYLRDWLPTLQEFKRVLRLNGRLVFSTHHPIMDFRLHNLADYFAITLIEDEWSTGKVSFYRRPLTKISADLHAARFVIERLLEPQPVAEEQWTDRQSYEKLMHNPWFLVIRARRD